jgi:hypothetical protein
LPEGYITACTIFRAFEEIDNEGVETALENLGAEYCAALESELRRVGIAELGETFRIAWRSHPEGAQPDAVAFAEISSKLHEQIEDDATLQAIFRYMSGNARLFEQA